MKMWLSNVLLFTVAAAASLLFTSCSKQETKKSYLKRGEFSQNETFRLARHMTYDELKKEVEGYKKANNYAVALKFLDQAIKKCDKPEELRQLRLEYADMLFFVGKYEDAAKEYKEYVQVYPASPRAPYAEFQSINAVCKEVLSPDRDQTKTQEALDLATDFAKKAHRVEYQPYVAGVETMAYRCVHRLYENEVIKFYFSLNHSQLKAAQAHIDYIKERFQKKQLLPEIEPEIIELEYELAAAQNNTKKMQAKKLQLQKKFPHYVMHPEKKRGYAAWTYEAW